MKYSRAQLEHRQKKTATKKKTKNIQPMRQYLFTQNILIQHDNTHQSGRSLAKKEQLMILWLSSFCPCGHFSKWTWVWGLSIFCLSPQNRQSQRTPVYCINQTWPGNIHHLETQSSIALDLPSHWNGKYQTVLFTKAWRPKTNHYILCKLFSFKKSLSTHCSTTETGRTWWAKALHRCHRFTSPPSLLAG